MAGALDFLFQGQAPIGAPTGSDTSTQFPLWLQQAIFNTIGAATDVAGQPFQQFPGPRVAAPTGATQEAWRMGQQNVGGYHPFMQQAGALTAAATKPWSADSVTPFLNPYQDYVTQGLNRNLQQNILPDISARFVGAGQSRSPQEQEMAMRAAFDTQGAIGQSMAGGYGQAMNAALSHRGQQMAGGQQFGELGALGQRLGLADIGQMAASGEAQDRFRQTNLDSAYRDFEEQRQYPYQNLGYLSDVVRGLPVQYGGYTTQQAGIGYPESYAPSPFAAFLNAGFDNDKTGKRRGGLVRRSPYAPMPGALSYRRAA